MQTVEDKCIEEYCSFIIRNQLQYLQGVYNNVYNNTLTEITK